MSRLIKCDEKEITQALNKLEELLRSGRFQEGKISFSHVIPEMDNSAELVFSNKAWIKIMGLVTDFDDEVQWHGIVTRISDTKFKVEDIIVFPHKITSTTVDTDQEEYESWLDSLDDETFNHLKLHGHSHVNMAVSPSSVDMKYRRDRLELVSLQEEYPFRIFIIVNKKNQISGEIYDFENNIIYGTADIDFRVEIEEDALLSDFLEEAHCLATKYVYKSTYTNNNHSSASVVTIKSDKKNKKKEDFSSMGEDKIEYEDDYDWFNKITEYEREHMSNYVTPSEDKISSDKDFFLKEKDEGDK